MRFKVVLESKEKHRLELAIDVLDQTRIKNEVQNKIVELGYESYDYKIKFIIPLTNA